MVAVATDDKGKVLVEKIQEGGSNNIAELLAVKEALMWCSVRGIKKVEIRTDSRNNLAWVYGKKVGKKINDREMVLNLKTIILALNKSVNFSLTWIPREYNLAGQYIENKFQL